MTVEFQFKHITFVVKRSLVNPETVIYRDKKHIGGHCWANAIPSIANVSLDRGFRKSLADAVEKVLDS